MEPARVPHGTLRRVHHSFLTRCIGQPVSYLDTLTKAGSESIEAVVLRRWILFAGFVARIEDTRLSKCVMFGELVRGASCVEGRKKE